MEEILEQQEAPQTPDEIETPQTEEEVVPTLEDYNKLAETKKQLSARLAKAEAELKANKQKPLEKTNQELTRDEVVLIAKGIPVEDIEQAKVIQAGKKAMGEALSLQEIYEKDLAMVAIREKREAERKSEKAALGAGKATQTSAPEFPMGMSEEDHKKAWQKYMAENA